MKPLLILKISREKVINFSEVTKFSPKKIFPDFFFPNKVSLITIDHTKPTCLDCVNSNIYSFMLSLLKLHWTFWFMN